MNVSLGLVTGAILAGGRSSRFGRDKALEPWRGRRLIEWVALALGGCGERIVVGGTAKRYGFLGLEVVPDAIPEAGPLGGLATALDHARFERVALVACDMPALTPEFWVVLASRQAEAVVPEGPDGRLEPTASIFSRACLGPVRAALAAGELRMTGIIERVRAEVVPWTELDERFGPGLFLNANRPADLEVASRNQTSGVS